MIIRIHRAIAAEAPGWRFCRGLLIGFTAGCVVAGHALGGERQQRVHTIVQPATYAVAVLG